MRKAHQVLAGVLAAFVVIQAMAIAYAIAGFGHWLENGGVANKAVLDSWDKHPPHWRGSGGFALHGIDGTMIIPLLAIVLLVVSLLANRSLPGAAARGGILFGMVALQIILGLSSHDVVALAPVHALNGFGIFAMAIMTVRKASTATRSEPAAATVAA
jgi:hypothetical protein